MSSQSDGVNCPLCSSSRLLTFAQIQSKEYSQCDICHLIFLLPQHFVSTHAELAHYQTHQNNPDDAGYRAFLNRLAIPLVERLHPGSKGLDYGSGPGPTLSVMLEEQGFEMELYDPFFAPDTGVLQRSYDFITCTETAEHFHSPASEFERFNHILRPGSWLGVMTEMVTENSAFANWYYRRDPTHVCFYSQPTMRWIAARYDWSVEFPHRNVTLFQRAG